MLQDGTRQHAACAGMPCSLQPPRLTAPADDSLTWPQQSALAAMYPRLTLDPAEEHVLDTRVLIAPAPHLRRALDLGEVGASGQANLWQGGPALEVWLGDAPVEVEASWAWCLGVDPAEHGPTAIDLEAHPVEQVELGDEHALQREWQVRWL